MIAGPIRIRHAGSDKPQLAYVLGLRRCYRVKNYFHGASDPECDCLRVELPVEARAKSSGRLGTPDRDHDCEECGGSGATLLWFGFQCSEAPCSHCSGRGGIPARVEPYVLLHQCSDKPCGGTFTCDGCERVVGWCFGAGDQLGAEHCDDCWKERHDLLAFLADGPCSPAKIERRFGGCGWRQNVADILQSLRDDHFIYRVSRGFALTILGREALS